MNRQQIDKRMSLKLINKVLSPLADDLGAKYLVDPVMMNYDHENKSIKWRFGYDKHGDKRKHTTVVIDGTFIRDGELDEGKVQTIERDYRIGWSRKHDNRLVQNQRSRGCFPHAVQGVIQQAAVADEPGRAVRTYCNGAGRVLWNRWFGHAAFEHRRSFRSRNREVKPYEGRTDR